MRIKQKNYIVISSKRRKGAVPGAGNGEQQQYGVFEFFFRERERLLSSFPANPTVGIRRDKKQSCSTHRDLRVGPGFVIF